MLKVSELANKFLVYAEVRLKSSTLANYKRHISAFVKLHGDKQVTDLLPHDLMTFGTNWHKMQAIQRLFRWGKKEAGIIKKDPFRKLRRPKQGQRQRTITRKECVRMMRKARLPLRQVIVTLRETIARPGEARQLQWEHIKRSSESLPLSRSLRNGECVFVLYEHKTESTTSVPNKPRILPINRRLGRFLARLLENGIVPKGHILLNGENVPWTKDALRQSVRRVCKRAKVDPDFNGESVVAYSFRHSGATAAALVGVRDKILSELLGHTTGRCTARYLHLCHDHLQAGILQIEGGRKARKLI